MPVPVPLFFIRLLITNGRMPCYPVLAVTFCDGAAAEGAAPELDEGSGEDG